MLSKLFHRFQAQRAFLPPQPDRSLAVIGDLHGCYDLLQKMLEQIPQETQIVLVGDYIDRGPNSAQVLRFLHASPNLICLKGNHEDMLLRFLEAPTREGTRWLKHGGTQTLASFGLKLSQFTGVKKTQAEALLECRNALTKEMGAELVNWLKSLPTSHFNGNIFIAHAGAHPQVRLDRQDPRHLIWGHPKFNQLRRRDGIWVAHGHVIQDRPAAAAGCIAIDTGAYATGVLSAAYIGANENLRFLQVTL